MATDIGKVGVVGKGTWSNSATYEALDAVYYNGTSYFAKQDVPAGTLPTNTTYWQQMMGAPAIESDTITIADLNPNITGKMYLRKQNDVVSIYFYDLRATAFSTLSAAIPEKYRPLTHSYRTIVCKLDGTYGGSIDIATSGDVAFTGMTVNVYNYGTLTYVR